MTIEHAGPYLKSVGARTPISRPANVLKVLGALALMMFVAGALAATKPPQIDESELLALGFKVLVPTTKAQEDWVKRLAPGQIRAMQRTGKKFYIVPDASKKQIYVGGPNEYAAYREAHPDSKLFGQEGAKQASAYRAKQDVAMQKATARDYSDPFLGVSWYDLGY
jgi:hypothetical protein